jgi:hypothetical protein
MPSEPCDSIQARARTNMPIWPWKAVSRPNGFAPSISPGVLDEREGLRRRACTKGTGANGAERRRQDHGPGAGAAAAVRRGERLVEVDVHGVDAELAGFGATP